MEGKIISLDRNIELIVERTRAHPELGRAHHFLYDLRQPKAGEPEFVVMGVNPGETAYDWKISPSPTEETSRFDFHDELGGGRSAIRWSKAANYFLGGADYVLSELFFWSSSDSREFVERFGPLGASPHLQFCVELNRQLIDFYRPKAVVLPGLSHARLAQSAYGLKPLGVLKDGASRVVEVATDGERPWLFTKHWTAAFGFTKHQRELVRQSILDAVSNLNLRESGAA